jgi:hypothetical protein
MPKSTLELDQVLKPERLKGFGIALLSSVIQERGRGREARLCLMMMIWRWRWGDIKMVGDLCRCSHRRRRILSSRRWRRGRFMWRVEEFGCVCEASFLRGSYNYSYSMLQARSTPKTPISQLTGITASHLLSTMVGSSASHSFLYSIGPT